MRCSAFHCTFESKAEEEKAGENAKEKLRRKRRAEKLFERNGMNIGWLNSVRSTPKRMKNYWRNVVTDNQSERSREGKGKSEKMSKEYTMAHSQISNHREIRQCEKKSAQHK